MRPFSPLLSIAVAAVVCCAVTPAMAGPADDQYAVAAGQYARGRWQLALEEFETYLSQYRGEKHTADAEFFSGEALMQLGEVAKARPFFEAFAASAPDHKFAPQALFRRGECAYLMGDYGPARKFLTEFHKAHGKDPLNAYALPYLGDLALKQGDGAKAQNYYTDALREHGETALADQCRYGLARALQMQRRFDDAARFYQFLINKPDSPLADDSLLQFGRLQYEREQYDDALATLDSLHRKFPQSDLVPYTHYWTGMTQLAKENFAAAIDALQKASSVAADHPLTPAIRFQLGEAYRRSDRSEESGAQYQLVLDQSPKSSWADDASHGLMRLASETNQHDAVEQAAAQFLKDHAASDLSYDVRRLQGRAELKQEQYETAIATLTKLESDLDALVASGGSRRLSRSDAKTLADSTRYLLGLAYVGAQQYAAADRTIAALSPNEQTEPQLAASVNAVRAAALIGQEKYGEAVTPLRTYLRLDPDGPDANKSRAQLAVALAETDRLDEAQRIYDDLAKQHTDRNEFLETTYFLAEAAFRAGEKPWARELFTVLADEKNPAEFREKGLSGKAWCELDLKAPERSAETFNALLKEFPDSPLVPQAALARASALEQAGDQDAALAMYTLIINEHPESKQLPDALYRAAKLYDTLQQDKQAEALLTRYLKDYPNQPNIDEALYLLAWVLQDQKRPDEAAAIFAKLHRDYKQSRFWPDATHRLAEQASMANDYDRVAELVDEMIASGTKHNVLSYAIYLKGQTAAKLGRWADVAAPMRQLLRRYPNFPSAISAEYWIAESLYRQGKYAEATEQFAKLAQRTESQTDTWLAIIPLRRAQGLAQDKKWAAAFALADTINNKFPGFSQQYEADYLMGRCLANQAQFAEARAAYERAITSAHGRRTETAAIAQWNIGETYFHQKDYENAIKAYNRVELLYDFPRWQASSLLQAGKCYEMLGQWKEAVASYQEILDQFAQTDSTEEATRRMQIAATRAAARESARNEP